MPDKMPTSSAVQPYCTYFPLSLRNYDVGIFNISNYEVTNTLVKSYFTNNIF